MLCRFNALMLIAAVCLLTPATSGTAAEIKVLNANALTIAMKEIAAEFSKETGHQVSFNGMSRGLVDRRIKAVRLFVLAAYRRLDPGSEWRLQREWFERTALPDLLGS
jgi:ABC-type molybdate transport system substrate-binding protein